MASSFISVSLHRIRRSIRTSPSSQMSGFQVSVSLVSLVGTELGRRTPDLSASPLWMVSFFAPLMKPPMDPPEDPAYPAFQPCPPHPVRSWLRSLGGAASFWSCSIRISLPCLPGGISVISSATTSQT